MVFSNKMVHYFIEVLSFIILWMTISKKDRLGKVIQFLSHLSYLIQLHFYLWKYHRRIIKWTQHIDFLTLAGITRAVERNYGNNSKRRVARILCLSSLAKFDYSLHFYFYERKQNKRVHALYRAIVTITEDCWWLIFFKLSTQFNLILYSIN